jgi:predicted GNAT family acetyltransferase
LGTIDAMTDVTHSPGSSRFEAGPAYLSYDRAADTFTIEHTVVPADLEGQGIGGKLVQAAVDHARNEGLTVVAHCSFARGWLDRHPDAEGRQ